MLVPLRLFLFYWIICNWMLQSPLKAVTCKKFIVWVFISHLTLKYQKVIWKLSLVPHIMYLKIFFYGKKVFTAGSCLQPAVLMSPSPTVPDTNRRCWCPHHQRFWNRRWWPRYHQRLKSNGTQNRWWCTFRTGGDRGGCSSGTSGIFTSVRRCRQRHRALSRRTAPRATPRAAATRSLNLCSVHVRFRCA